MSIRMDVYQFLVNREPAIQKEYWKRRKKHTTALGRAGDWGALIGLNVAWGLGYRSWAEDEANPDEKLKVSKVAESSLFQRKAPKEMAEFLLQFDVISFDVFDTLVFRYFEKPVDLFHVVGGKLHYLDYAGLRQGAEWDARKKNYKRTGSYEVTLDDIYDVMEANVGISKEVGMQLEIDTELEYCFGNPYMLEVFNYMKANPKFAEKMVICTSDMYLSAEVISKMLRKCGFTGIQRVLVSCEEGVSKSKGDFYPMIQKQLGDDLRYVHTGDNVVADVEKAEAAGWTSNHYRAVNELGENYRARDLSLLTGSLYRGVTNAHLYCGKDSYSRNYEIGFTYGGLFVTGFAQWIHEYVKNNQIEKILFLARDGDIVSKVYRNLYPEDADKICYVYWSRIAATKLGAKYFKFDFIRRFLYHKVNQEIPLSKIFASMELEDMLPDFIREWKENPHIKEELNSETLLTSENCKYVEKALKKYWKSVLAHYEKQRNAAGDYFRPILGNASKVATVDVGWAGSGAVVLDYLFNYEWGCKTEVHSLLAGTNTLNNGAEKDSAEGVHLFGLQSSYLFSQDNNREFWKVHHPGKGHNLLWEMLLSSDEPSTKGFSYDADGKVVVLKGEPDQAHESAIREIQKGILDFSSYWKALPREHKISGSDAYQLVRVLTTKNNEALYKEIEAELFDDINVG